MHKETIDVLRHCSSGKTLGEILGEVKISSQVITQTDNFLSNKIVLSKSIVLNWSAEGERSWVRGAPWLCGAWGAASSSRSPGCRSVGQPLAGGLSNPAGLPKPLLRANWHCWHCLPGEMFGCFQFLGKKPSGVGPTPAGTESCGTCPSQGHHGQGGFWLPSAASPVSPGAGSCSQSLQLGGFSGLSCRGESPLTNPLGLTAQGEQRPFSLPGKRHQKQQLDRWRRLCLRTLKCYWTLVSPWRSQNRKLQGRLPRVKAAGSASYLRVRKSKKEVSWGSAVWLSYVLCIKLTTMFWMLGSEARYQLRYQLTWDQHFVRWLHEIQWWTFHGPGYVKKGSFKIACCTSSVDMSFSIIHEHWGKIRQWSLEWEFINFLHGSRNVRGVKLRIIKVKLLRYIYCARKNITLSISDSIQCLSVHVSLIGMQGVYLLYCLHLSEKI